LHSGVYLEDVATDRLPAHDSILVSPVQIPWCFHDAEPSSDRGPVERQGAFFRCSTDGFAWPRHDDDGRRCDLQIQLPCGLRKEDQFVCAGIEDEPNRLVVDLNFDPDPFLGMAGGDEKAQNTKSEGSFRRPDPITASDATPAGLATVALASTQGATTMFLCSQGSYRNNFGLPTPKRRA
jgi:hypothetical protein